MEPIVGPEFWEDSNEPFPLPPKVKPQAGRPKKRRNTKNDVPRDPTKLKRQHTKVHCTYCKACGHNWRTCAARVFLIHVLLHINSINFLSVHETLCFQTCRKVMKFRRL